MDEVEGPLCDPHEIIELARSGDMEALDRMTRCYGRRLEAVGRRACLNRDDADDAVQEALLSAGKNLSSYRGEGSLEAWLLRMVVNACHRMRRGRKNDPGLHDSDVELLAGPDDPEELASRGQLMTILGEMVGELQPRDRLIFLLAEADDWTGPQIAEKLDMKPDAVRARLSRVRKRLREQISTRAPTL